MTKTAFGTYASPSCSRGSDVDATAAALSVAAASRLSTRLLTQLTSETPLAWEVLSS